MNENEVAEIVVDGAFEVHRSLGGPGLLETIEEALAFELESRGLSVVRQRTVPLV
jgi:GxxExxY protein